RDWDSLEKAFLARPFFPMRAVVMRESDHQTRVRLDWPRRAMAIVLVTSLGLWMIVGSVYLDESRFHSPVDWVPTSVIKVVAPLVGLFLILMGGHGLVIYRQIIIDRSGRRLELRFVY